jgi:hypothetical protein
VHEVLVIKIYDAWSSSGVAIPLQAFAIQIQRLTTPQCEGPSSESIPGSNFAETETKPKTNNHVKSQLGQGNISF